MIGPIAPYNSITKVEIAAAIAAMDDGPLSGYLAGQERGGKMVRALEDAWQETFNVRHAIACNSNTSGLMAAAFAVGLGPGDDFACPAMTMTATAAAPMFTGATPIFCDVEDETFGLSVTGLPFEEIDNWPVFATNLFGHPCDLRRIRQWCDANGTYLIEDNAQAPFATERERYTGCIGHIGVFSLNVHKHFHCGEGGVIVTNDDHLAWRMRGFINHGEHIMAPIGLNLRMPEVSAAIAGAQLRRAYGLVAQRVVQAQEIIAAIGDVPGIRPPVVRDDCVHVYYTIPFLIDGDRAAFCHDLRNAGVPVVEGYADPLYRMTAFKQFGMRCPNAEDLHDRRLFYIENCAYNFTHAQISLIGDAFKRAAEKAR